MKNVWRFAVFAPVVFFLMTPILHDVLPGHDLAVALFWKAILEIYGLGLLMSIIPLGIYSFKFRGLSKTQKEFSIINKRSLLLWVSGILLTQAATFIYYWYDSDSFYLAACLVTVITSVVFAAGMRVKGVDLISLSPYEHRNRKVSAVNPTTGIPMISTGVDAGGNYYGSTNKFR
jgi:hypothetical protein